MAASVQSYVKDPQTGSYLYGQNKFDDPKLKGALIYGSAEYNKRYGGNYTEPYSGNNNPYQLGANVSGPNGMMTDAQGRLTQGPTNFLGDAMPINPNENDTSNVPLANGQQPGSPQTGVTAPTAPGATPPVPPSQQAFQNIQSAGVPPPQSAGQAKQIAGQAINQATPPPQPNYQNIDFQLSQDPGFQQLLFDRQQYNSTANQSSSLLDFYNKALENADIPGLNTQLLNYKRVIDGTEDDIRKEVQAVGGFATESQVMALAGARNKQLIKNYNNLLDEKQMAMESINNMTNLAGQDRQFAQQSALQRLNIDSQLIEYRDKFVNNAKEAYKNVITNIGYAGLYNSLKNDPGALSLAERTLGLAPGQLQGLASYVKPLTLKEQLENKKLEADIAQSSASTQKTLAEIEQLPLDNELKRAQIAKYWADINAAPKVNTQVVDVGGKKVLINSDTGETIKELNATEAADAQTQASSKANIDLASGLISNSALNGAVGPNALSRLAPWQSITGAKSNFLAGVQQLTSQLTLDSLIRAKAAGATFGALSEGELNILSGSASKLNSWAIKDKNGNVIGYNTSEKSFKAELDKINNFAKLDYILKGGDPSQIGVQVMPDGTLWTTNSDGTKTQLLNSNPNLNKAGKPEASEVKGYSSTPKYAQPINLNYTPLQKQNLSYAPDIQIPKVSIGAGAAVKNNNPGNLRNSDGSWMRFKTAEEGFKGLMGYLQRAVTGNHSAYNGNQSLYQFFSKYAPSSDNNDPKGYAESVAKRLGVSANTKISQLDIFAWAKEIARHESNTKVG